MHATTEPMTSNLSNVNICYFVKFARVFFSAPRCCAYMCKLFASEFVTNLSAGLPAAAPLARK